MREMRIRQGLLGAAVLGAALLGACRPRESRTGTTGMAGPAGGAESMPPAGAAETAGAKPAPGALTDANIVALLDEANRADSTAGALAFRKAANRDVKAFASLMMGEHHGLRVQGQRLAKKLNLTPEPPANDPVQPLAKAEMESLQAAPKGAQFDRTYIDQEVKVHQAVLDLVNQSHDAAQNPELKALIEKAKPVIQRHLDRAEAIQQRLGKPTA